MNYFWIGWKISHESLNEEMWFKHGGKATVDAYLNVSDRSKTTTYSVFKILAKLSFRQTKQIVCSCWIYQFEWCYFGVFSENVVLGQNTLGIGFVFR